MVSDAIPIFERVLKSLVSHSAKTIESEASQIGEMPVRINCLNNSIEPAPLTCCKPPDMPHCGIRWNVTSFNNM